MKQFDPLFPSLATLHVKRKMMLLFCLMCVAAFINAQQYPQGFSQVEIVDGLTNPTVMAFAPDGRIFIAEQDGTVLVYKNGQLLATPALQLSVQSQYERGLGGMVLDPNFSSNGYIYLYYTLPDGSRNMLNRFTVTGDVIDPNSVVPILELDRLSGSSIHNGGGMHFKDGKLFLAVGDNAIATRSQDLNTYHGKFLRINPDGSAPTDNPFYSEAASEQAKRIWSMGLRNPYTFDIHPTTGRILLNDVGFESFEEINDATQGGLNFGWPLIEGMGNDPQYTNPIFTYGHGKNSNVTGCAIVGGVFFSPASTNYPAEYSDKYFYQEYCNGWIRYLDLANGNESHLFATGLPADALSLTLGADGNLYYLSRNGSVFRIVYNSSEAPVITDQPDDVTISAGEQVTFRVTASGSAPLTYQWRKNQQNISGANSATYTISNVQESHAGDYDVIVTNNVGSVTSDVATLTVTAFNARPVATITSPSADKLYYGGEVINFSGNATDPEDGSLPASALTWIVIFHHDDHVHDGPPVAQGAASGSFTIPAVGEVASNVWYRLYLVATDSQGLKDTTYVDIHPKKVSITLASQPSGLQLTLDGQPVTTPHTVQGVEGIERELGAQSPQSINGVPYKFDSWSHGGERNQIIVTPGTNVTYTANFSAVDPGDADLPSPWLSSDVGSVGVAGVAEYDEGEFSVSGSGADVWSSADAFHYVYQPFTGDLEVQARVTSQAPTDVWAKAGVMVRENLNNNARNVYLALTPSNGIAFQRRTTSGGSSQINLTSGEVPYWIKLKRVGNVFTAFTSSDGQSWQEIATATVILDETVFVGLAVVSKKNNELGTATFTNVSVNDGSGIDDGDDDDDDDGDGDDDDDSDEGDEVVNRGIYRIEAVHSNMVMTVANASVAANGNVVQEPYEDGDHQHWMVRDEGNGYVRLMPRHSTHSLDVTGISTKDGANVVQWYSYNGQNQMYTLRPAGQSQGVYEIVARHSNKCVEVVNASEEDQANIQQATCSGAANQQWRFHLVGMAEGQPTEVIASSRAEAERMRPLLAYPNPLEEGILQLESGLAAPSSVRVTVVNSMGQVVHQERFRVQSSGIMKHEIDLSHIPSGTYVVRMVSKNENYSTLFIKK